MSNYDYEDDDDFTTDDSSNDLVKQLRKASKTKDKEIVPPPRFDMASRQLEQTV